MGDRALVIFTDSKREEVSPTIYLHWGGNSVPALIINLKALMAGREDDVQYAAARFVGLAHETMPGNLSLGIWNTDDGMRRAVRSTLGRVLAEASHGDAGVVVVNARDFTWQAFGGYLADRERVNA